MTKKEIEIACETIIGRNLKRLLKGRVTKIDPQIVRIYSILLHNQKPNENECKDEDVADDDEYFKSLPIGPYGERIKPDGKRVWEVKYRK